MNRSIFEPAPAPWPDRALSVLRIVAGLLFVTFGTMKVFGFPPPPGGGAMPPFDLATQMGIGGLMEVIGGLAILLGLFTRPVAFLLSGEMAVAYFQFHAPNGFFPSSNQGVPAILFCFLFLYLVFAGAGPWSVDAAIARSSRHGSGRP